MSTSGFLNSTFLAPWDGQLVPCNSRYECTVVNGTQIAGLVYNVLCATLAEAETLENYSGYCVCPPYQLRGGPTCSDETSLGIPIATTETVTGSIVDIALIVTLCKLYSTHYKSGDTSLKGGKRRRCSRLFVQILLLSTSAIVYVLGHCFQLAIILGELATKTRFLVRTIYVLVLLPLPLLLAVGAVLLLAARFHLILSTMSVRKNVSKSSGFITTTVVVLVAVVSSIGLIGMSLITGKYSYFVIVVLLLILFSSAYFAIAIRYTVSKLKAQSKFSGNNDSNHTHNIHAGPRDVSHNLALLLSGSVKRYIIINAFGTVFLVTACYLSVLPQETTVDVSKSFYWILTPLGLGTRITTFSIANFLYELESNAGTNNNSDPHTTTTDATTRHHATGRREKPMSQPEVYNVDHMYEKGTTEELAENIVTVC